MPYFDYNLPQVPDYSEGISRLGDALTDVLNRRQKQQQFDADLALRRDQESRRLAQQDQQFQIQNEAQRRRDEQAEAKFAIEQNQVQQGLGKNIQEAPTMAEKRRIAAAGVYYNPETRQIEHPSIEQGATPDVGPEPQQPSEADTQVQPTPPEIAAARAGRIRRLALQEPSLGPKAQPPSLFPGGSLTAIRPPSVAGTEPPPGATHGLPLAVKPELASQRLDLEQALERQSEAATDERARAAAALNAREAYPAAHDEYVAARSRAEEQTPYTVKFGKGAEFTSTLAGERYEANTRNAQAFGASLPETGLTNSERRARAATMAALESGTIRKEQAGAFFQKYANGIETGEIKESEGEKNRTAAETRARIAAEGRREATTQTGERGAHQEEKDNRKQVSDDIDKFLAGRGAKDLASQLADVDRTLEKLKSGNTRESSTAVLNMLRSDIGKGSRLNMYEVRHFGIDSGLSAGDALANRFEQYMTGGQADKAHELAVGAMQHLHQNLRARGNAIGEEGKARFINDPNYAEVRDYADNLLAQRVPGYTRIRQQQAAPPEVAAGRSAQRKVTLRGMSKEQLRAAAKAAGVPLPPNEGP